MAPARSARPGRRRPGDLVTVDPSPRAPRRQVPPDDDEESPEAGRRAAVDAFLRESRRRWQTADNATNHMRQRMREEQRFAAGDGAQWELTDRTFREQEGRPCLEINRIPQFIRQVANQARINRSQIQVNPRGRSATVESAAAWQGLMRSIEVESDAEIAYDTAVDHQLRIGLGFVRLRAKYDAPESWHQVCSIDRIRNPLSVYWDPATQEATFGDARYLHIVSAIGRDEYEARWGEISPYASLTDYVTHDTTAADWMPEGKVIVAEYFYVETTKRKLLQLESGHSVWEDDLQHFAQAWQLAYPGEVLPAIRRSKEVYAPTVFWALHNAVDILEGNVDRTSGRKLPGSRIPIFPVIGDELDLDGAVDYRGMIHDAVGPQKMYNFWASSIAETIGLVPKAPWIAAAGQVEEYLDQWKEANRTPLSVLLYDPKTVEGQIVPPPQRTTVEPPVQAMVLGLKEADNDLKAVMGLFEASLGEPGPQQSGLAINAVQQQGVLANSNYLDNLQRTKRAIGRSLLEWIPVIYDAPRVVHLLRPDGKRQPAVVHAGPAMAPAPQAFPGVTDIFDLSVGAYEVTINTGPSFQSERQATEQVLLELFKILPNLAGIGADILLENSDAPAAQQLAKRAKLLLPPQVQDAADPAAALPRLTTQNAQLQQLLMKANAVIQAMGRKLDSQQVSADARIKVALIQAQAQMDQLLAKIGSQKDLAIFDAEFERFTQVVDHLSQMTLQTADAAHDATMTALTPPVAPPGAAPGTAPSPPAPTPATPSPTGT